MIEEKLREVFGTHVANASPDLEDLKENSTEQYLVILLSVFVYNVRQGGFAQLLYNLSGLYLEDLALALKLVGAEQSSAAMTAVIQSVLDDVESYKEFTAGNFAESEFKNLLHDHSLAYYSSGLSLDDEISETTLHDMLAAAGITYSEE